MKEFINKIKLFYKKISDIVTPTAVLAIICVVVTLALSSTNLLTAEKIATLAIETQNNAMDKLIEADEYHWSPATTTEGDITYYSAIKGGKTIGLIFVTESKGYGGAVSVMTAVDMDCKVVAIEILSADNETPGLGQNITKESFYTQFKGLAKDIAVKKGNSAVAENNEINAVTGATLSSKAVTNAVNQALEYAQEIIVKEEP